MLAALRRLAGLLGAEPEAIPWHMLRFQHTDALRARLLGGAFGRRTVLVTLAALRGVLRQAQRMGHLPSADYQAATQWDRVKGDNATVGRELAQAEIDAVQRYVATLAGRPYGALLEAVFALCLGGGLRAVEASHAVVGALDTHASTITVLGKGNKMRVVPLGSGDVVSVQQWLTYRQTLAVEAPTLLLRVQPDDTVSEDKPMLNEQALIQICRRISKETGIASFRPHDLRRTFITRSIRMSGGDIFAVQTIAGHARPETTKGYDKRQLEEIGEKRRTWSVWRPPTTEKT
jgi:site-specific recombinase XerC